MEGSIGDFKIVKIFPDLLDISPFVDRNHLKDTDPRTSLYIDYWERVERKCIEGMWGFDGIRKSKKTLGGYRYMPPQLYYLINLCKVPVQRGNIFRPELPFLHDLEWLQAYHWLVCRGFSGFEGDKKVSCFAPLEKMLKNIPLTEDDKYLIDIYNSPHLDKKGRLKQYVDPVQYLYKTHPEELGLPLYENKAQDLLTFGSRGGTKTTFSAICCILHEFKFYGAQRFDSDYFKAARNGSGKNVFISTPVDKNIGDYVRVLNLNIKYQKLELGSYRSGHKLFPGPFHQNAQGKLEAGNSKNPYKHIIKYVGRDEDGLQTSMELESGASISIGLCTTENPAPMTGGRYTTAAKDEVGLNPNLRKGHELDKATMQIDIKFGSANMSGTSGELNKVADAYHYFYNPRINDILTFENVYEPGGGEIAFFLCATLTDRKLKDEMGNTLLERAYKARLERREALKNDPDKLSMEKLKYPLIPSEMFGGNNSFVLPKGLAAKHLIYLDRTKDYWNDAETGNFEYDSQTQTVKWHRDLSKRANMLVEHEPHKKERALYGVPVIYEHPVANLPPRTLYNNLYKVVGDPIKDDGTEGKVSLFCGYVYKGLPDKSLDVNCMQTTIVASIICRRDESEAGLYICFYFAMYYNAYFLFEGNIGPTMTLARLMGWKKYLQPTPTSALAKGKPVRESFGIVMTGKHKQNGWPYLKSFYTEIVGYDQVTHEPITRLETIKCRMQIEQVVSFTMKESDNFDCLSCMLVLMYWLLQENMSVPSMAEETVDITYEELFTNHLASAYENLNVDTTIWD